MSKWLMKEQQQKPEDVFRLPQRELLCSDEEKEELYRRQINDTF
jgi:hypothetical protein